MGNSFHRGEREAQEHQTPSENVGMGDSDDLPEDEQERRRWKAPVEVTEDDNVPELARPSPVRTYYPKPPELKTGDEAYGRVEYQPGWESEVSFCVVLHCTGGEKEKAASSVQRTLVVKEGMPLTVRDLKSCIEKEFNIPSCCQRLVFESVPMTVDTDPLSFYHVRDGDRFQVDYPSEGNVAEVLGVVEHMSRSYHLIRSIQGELSEQRVSDDLDDLVEQGVFWEKVNDLPEVYFTPCSSEKAEANRNLFIQCGGLDMLQRLHSLLLEQPWSHMPLRMQYMEHAILRTYWNITAAFTVRLYVLQYPQALGSILRSFLRVQLKETELLKVPRNVYGLRTASQNELNRIACEVVYKAMGGLCNLAEIPECRMQIAADKEVLKQLVVTLVTPCYNSIASLVAMAGMLCLAYSAKTHTFLATPTIINGVLGACQIRRPDYITESQRKKKLLLLKYFANVLFAQLVTTSPQFICREDQLRILQFMEEFLEQADHVEIREEEVRNGYKWSTLLPFMKLAYHPFAAPRRRRRRGRGRRGEGEGKEEEASEANGRSELDSQERLRLDRCCIKCGIFSLSNVLLCKETREIFVREGLLDYTLCLPWVLPPHWHERESAHTLVTYLAQQMQLQPPSLINMCRARLAATHFGLEKVLRTGSVHQLLSEVYS